MTFVESRSPPIPHSIRTILHFRRKNSSKAAAVRISNSVGFSSISSHIGEILQITSESSFSVTSLPSMRKLSVIEVMAGEEKLPAVYPAADSTELSIAPKLPFPFVPEICITRSFSCGSSILCRSSRTLESPSTLPCLRAFSRSCHALSESVIETRPFNCLLIS